MGRLKLLETDALPAVRTILFGENQNRRQSKASKKLEGLECRGESVLHSITRKGFVFYRALVLRGFYGCLYFAVNKRAGVVKRSATGKNSKESQAKKSQKIVPWRASIVAFIEYKTDCA